MRTFTIFLNTIAPIFVLVGGLHLTLGLGADALLGAKVPSDAMHDAALDSQNRFYGVAFAVYGVLLFLCATDVRKYATVLRCLMWVMFAGGVARIVSIVMRGVPAPLVLGLLASELLVPPLVVWWLSSVVAAPDADETRQ